MSPRWGLLAVVPVVTVGLLAATPAEAYWNRGGGWHRGGWGPGPAIAGAVVGLGVGAALAGAYAPRYYAPPPVVYAAPPPVVYAAPPAYYAPPPAYYYGR